MSLVRAASTRLSSRTDTKGAFALALLLGVSACHATPRPFVTPAPPTAGGAFQLQRDIERILAAPTLTRSYWGIVDSSPRRAMSTLYSLNAGKLLMPGSTMKIVTLAAAAERLGWDYTLRHAPDRGRVDRRRRPRTAILSSSVPAIRASGWRNGWRRAVFAGWAETLKANGVRTITGRIVGNDNAFDDETLGPGWAWDDLQGRDATGVSGLQYNENTVQATITPGAAIGAAAWCGSLPPRKRHLDLDNELTTAAPGTAPSIVARRSPGSRSTRAARLDPARRASRSSRIVSVDNPTLFFVTALRDALISHGIEVRGAAVDIDDLKDAPSPAGGTLLVIHHSPPLSTLAVRLMKNSVNLYAETLLKTIGGSTGSPTFEGGRMVAGATLEPWGVSPTGVVQVDGSGLSRYNYVTR